MIKWIDYHYKGNCFSIVESLKSKSSKEWLLIFFWDYMMLSDRKVCNIGSSHDFLTVGQVKYSGSHCPKMSTYDQNCMDFKYVLEKLKFFYPPLKKVYSFIQT